MRSTATASVCRYIYIYIYIAIRTSCCKFLYICCYQHGRCSWLQPRYANCANRGISFKRPGRRGARLINDSSWREGLSTWTGQGVQLTGELSEGTPSLRVRAHNTPCHYDILDALILCVGHSEFRRQVLLQLWLPFQKLLALRIQPRQLTKRNACAVCARIANDGASSSSPHIALHSLVHIYKHLSLMVSLADE